MTFNVDEYKKLVQKYATYQEALESFDDARVRNSPKLRQELGDELHDDPYFFAGASDDRFLAELQATRNVEARKFQSETKGNLEDILAALDSGKLLGQVAQLGAPKNGEYKDIAKAHKELNQYLGIIHQVMRSQDANLIINFYLEKNKDEPELQAALKYFAANSDYKFWVDVFKRGPLRKINGKFTEYFVKEGTDKLDDGKVRTYSKYVLDNVKDENQFASAMLPLVSSAYLNK
ncbi:hypothetical protein J4438_00775 [Candidatus Woesearchaeota archaeon]|nr:hypothetical protein [Candidatus Woesearchaeota archaeon]